MILLSRQDDETTYVYMYVLEGHSGTIMVCYAMSLHTYWATSSWNQHAQDGGSAEEKNPIKLEISLLYVAADLISPLRICSLSSITTPAELIGWHRCKNVWSMYIHILRPGFIDPMKEFEEERAMFRRRAHRLTTQQ